MLRPDTIIRNRYRIVRELGRGGMGAVYEALDLTLGRIVALKETFGQTEELHKAFRQEARLLANLRHPSLPNVLDHFVEGDEQLLVMEYVPGPDLSQMLIERGEPFPLDQVLRWAEQILDVLEYLHGHASPVIHRDIKPSNIKTGLDGRIILLDFGLAKGSAGGMTDPVMSRSVAGFSPHYAPLEQIQGEKTGPQSDLYSLAATLYQLLTNRKPADALKRATTVINSEPDPLEQLGELNSTVPGSVAGVIMQALALPPTRRFTSAAAMRAALRHSSVTKVPSSLHSTDSSASLKINEEDLTRIRTIEQNIPPENVESVAGNSKLPNDRAETVTQQSESFNRSDGEYSLPDIQFLHAPTQVEELSDEELLDGATRLAEMFKAMNVTGRIVHINPGPVLTTYEFRPAPGTKYSRITNLADDICLTMKAPYVNIERVRGTSHVGIQVPNRRRETIHLRRVLESKRFMESASPLTVAFGETVDGAPYVADLKQLPHLLIAGATGAGKSVFINSLIISILYKARPDEVKFLLVDTKRLELGLYEGIPHLAAPVITAAKRASVAMKWAIAEMEERFKLIAAWGVRNVEDFNLEVSRRNLAKDFDAHGQPWRPLPYIVIIVDELADLMEAYPDEVEESLSRLSRKERAAGIHLVLATQRPSVNVITGSIKANFTARLSIRVASKSDSRIIIDTVGAEKLLGQGDMLFLPPAGEIVRIHGAYVDESEIGRVVSFLKAQGGPDYDRVLNSTEAELSGLRETEERDELFEDALRICVETKRASTSVLQRRLRIGFGRAAMILDQLEREGLIGQADGARPRPVLGRAYEVVSEWEENESA